MKKTIMLGIRCTPEERRVLEQLAAAERRNPAEMVRELIRDAARARQLWPPRADSGQITVSSPGAASGAL